jgi:branched-chain amino acid transport system substrate-binding protein
MKAMFYLALVASVAVVATQLRAADHTIRIGVLTDMSGVYAAPTGPGSVFAARQAAADFLALGKAGIKIEIIAGDHQNKPDIGASIANRWIDVDKVDVIVDVPTSSVAFVVNDIVKSKNKVFLASGAAASDLTGTRCSPNGPLDL